MIVYNVTIKVLQSVHDEWLEWMKTVHVPDVMNTGCFASYRMCKLDKHEEDENEEDVTYVFQYLAKNRADLDKYFSNHAADLRADVVKKFQDKFIAFRTLMEIVSEG